MGQRQARRACPPMQGTPLHFPRRPGPRLHLVEPRPVALPCGEGRGTTVRQRKQCVMHERPVSVAQVASLG